jgi:multidrug resistance efflux pump
MKEKKLDIRSEEVQDLMGQVPSWIIRVGTSVVLLLLVILLAGSWFFKYPDIVISPVQLTTQMPPAEVVARTDGKIEAVFVDDKQQVEKDDILAIIHNPANYYDVKALKDKLLDVKKSLNDTFFNRQINFQSDLELGELQPEYAGFLTLYNDYVNFIDLDYHQQKIQSLRDQIDRYNSHYGQLYRQREVLEDELTIARKQLSRSKVLLEKDVISQATYETVVGQVLEKKYAVERANTDLSNTKLKIQEIEQQILDFQLNKKGDDSEQQLAVLEAYENLTSAISQWMHTYVLLAPVDGLVSMTRFWSESQNVTNGETVFTVVAENDTEVLAKCVLPIKGSGKVQEGQKVNIKFDNYPFMEYGMVKAKVRSISLVPSNDHYVVQLDLPTGLKTTYDKDLNFSQQMTGVAEIITEDVRLFDRLFNPLKSFVYERLKDNG